MTEERGPPACRLALLPAACPFSLPRSLLAIAIAVALTRDSCYCVANPAQYTQRPAPTYSPASAATRLRDARHLLTGAILPPRSVAVTPPPEPRSKPASLFGGPPATDAGGRVWRLPLAVSQARAFFNTHPPRGTSPEGSNPTAEGSGNTALTGRYYGYHDSLVGPSGLTSLEVVVVLDDPRPHRRPGGLLTASAPPNPCRVGFRFTPGITIFT